MYPKDIVQELIEGQPKEIITKESTAEKTVEDLCLEFAMFDGSDYEGSNETKIVTPAS